MPSENILQKSKQNLFKQANREIVFSRSSLKEILKAILSQKNYPWWNLKMPDRPRRNGGGECGKMHVELKDFDI